MALIDFVCCRVCNQEKPATYSAGDPVPDLCDECRQTMKLDERQKYLEERARLPLEERLALVEVAIYDMSREQSSHFDWDQRIG